MVEGTGRWTKGCGIGCAVLVGAGVLGIALMVLSMRSSFVDANHHRESLETRFGEVSGFTPSADGSISVDRIEAFLAVRESLEEVVAGLVEVDDEMGEFEKLAEDDDPPMRVALPAIAGLTRSMLAMPRIFGEMEEVRNRALVESGMGLGEYTYLYVMAYHDEILRPEGGAHLFAASPVNRRVRADLHGMVQRQLEVAQTSPEMNPVWLDELAAEVAALEADEDRIPWQDHLPEAVASSFEPFRDRLDAAYWPAAAELDLLNSTVKHGGLQIEMG